MYPARDKKNKILTFSYDDGVIQDRRLIDMFNRYGLKATFNLNSGLMNEKGIWFHNETKIKRLIKDDIKDIYEGHEIAGHSLTHPVLTDLSIEEVKRELNNDKISLGEIFGYDIKGFAYPFGEYDESLIEILNTSGFKYARTVENTYDFDLPSDFLRWNPTCHHNHENIFNLIDDFLLDDNRSKLFYIWGHSYEFDLDNNWDRIEMICEMLSGRDDIWYATNIEIVNSL